MKKITFSLVFLIISIGQLFASPGQNLLTETLNNVNDKPANTFEITVTKPGNLKTQLLDLDADIIEGLVIKGKINGADLKIQ